MKDKVIRVTEEEKQLILYLRDNQEAVQKEITKVLITPNLQLKYLLNVNKILNKNSHLDDLINNQFITKEIFSDILENISLKNIVFITGDKGSGKTTLLNVLTEHIDFPCEKIEIEDLSTFFVFLTYLNREDFLPIIVTINGCSWQQGVRELLVKNQLNQTFIENIFNILEKNKNIVNYHTYHIYDMKMVYKK